MACVPLTAIESVLQGGLEVYIDVYSESTLKTLESMFGCVQSSRLGVWHPEQLVVYLRVCLEAFMRMC
jgi:hypothetical protein